MLYRVFPDPETRKMEIEGIHRSTARRLASPRWSVRVHGHILADVLPPYRLDHQHVPLVPVLSSMAPRNLGQYIIHKALAVTGHLRIAQRQQSPRDTV
jgi:hypothetical protein